MIHTLIPVVRPYVGTSLYTHTEREVSRAGVVLQKAISRACESVKQVSGCITFLSVVFAIDSVEWSWRSATSMTHRNPLLNVVTPTYEVVLPAARCKAQNCQCAGPGVVATVSAAAEPWRVTTRVRCGLGAAAVLKFSEHTREGSVYVFHFSVMVLALL